MAKKEKTEDNSKALATIQISAEIKAIADAIIEAGGECDQSTFDRLQAWNEALEIKAENIGHVKLRIESENAYWKQIEEAARAKRKAGEGAIERLTKYLALCMTVANVEQIKRADGLFTISLCQGRSRLTIEDSEKLPVMLVDVVEQIKPRTDEIKKLLEEGEEVPGAVLDYGENYVVIRTGKSKE